MSRLGTHRFLSTTEFHRFIHIPPDVYTLSTASNTARRLKILRAEDAKKKKSTGQRGLQRGKMPPHAGYRATGSAHETNQWDKYSLVITARLIGRFSVQGERSRTISLPGGRAPRYRRTSSRSTTCVRALPTAIRSAKSRRCRVAAFLYRPLCPPTLRTYVPLDDATRSS